MAGPTFLATPTELTISATGSYVDMDVSASVSSAATAAIIEIRNTATTNYGIYVRQNGSTDDRYVAGGGVGILATNPIAQIVTVGLDGDKIFELKAENAAIDN